MWTKRSSGGVGRQEEDVWAEVALQKEGSFSKLSWFFLSKDELSRGEGMTTIQE